MPKSVNPIGWIARELIMSRETVRIGGASGFWGDSQIAVPQLIERGNVQYLVFDYLAELTMSLLAAARNRNPEAGYAADFVEQIKPHLGAILGGGIRVVSNAGGVNPENCAAALRAIAAELGYSPRIAVVKGDDVLPLIPELRGAGIREFHSGREMPPEITTANAYLGAMPIKRALDAGADIVITGRCVDSAVTLGVLMHHFSWSPHDLDKLAMGSLAGHIIECGCQATGGLHTDWQKVPDWANIGYPVIEASADSTFVVTKPSETGGLVYVPAIAEQILYEVGDPARYVLPDVVCDFSCVQLVQQGENRVAVNGARGLPATDTYKVCATYPDGFRAVAQLTVVGFDAAAKARRTAEAILERTRTLFAHNGLDDYADTLIEILGDEAGYGPHASGHRMREAVMRLAVSHSSKEALQMFAREIAPAGTSWSPGTTGITGRPSVSRILKQFSFLLDKARVPVKVSIGETEIADAASSLDPAHGDQCVDANIPLMALEIAAKAPSEDSFLVSVPLVRVAYARSGDKGDTCNIGVIARTPQLAPYLASQLEAEKVKAYLSHLVKGNVTRYEVPGIHAFNFLCEGALGGGGMASLRNDPFGKSMGQILLSMPVDIPRELIEA